MTRNHAISHGRVRGSIATWGIALFALLLPVPAQSQNYELVWSDEFDGTSVDLSKWEFQIGTGCPSLCGWGNNELEYYRAENATVAGGFLTITAREESFGGRNYTSARMRTRNKGDWTYGRMEMRAKMPIGKGLWPAFWMLPTDEVYGTWAASGEIDIMEYVGDDPNRVFGTLHYGNQYPGNVYSGNNYLLPSGTFNDDFHEFALEWDTCEMRWYVDGNLYAVQNSWWSGGGTYPAPFNERFHLLLNVAVGGNLPGPPDGSTQFPQEMVVDYVRVYQQDRCLDCIAEFDNMEHGNPLGNAWFQFGSGGIGGNPFDLPPSEGCNSSLEAAYGAGAPGYVGGFGRSNPLDLTDMTHFSFWINPDASQEYDIEVNLQDDDDGDNIIPSSPNGADDEFQYVVHVGPTGPGAISGGGWQKISIPLSAFTDDNSFHFGGNGTFDPVPTNAGGNGQLVNVVFTLVNTTGPSITFRSDNWRFTREDMRITGRVWDDLDQDGVQDGGEPGLNSVTVNLLDAADAQVASMPSAGDGNFAFTGLPWGDFKVSVDQGTLPTNFDPTFDRDGLTTLHLAEMTLSCPDSIDDADFGYASNVVSVPVGGPAQVAFGLEQNIPNPFNGGTRIDFALPAEGDVDLAIYDLSGRRVATLVSQRMPAGRHSAEWNGGASDGRRVSPGVYHYILRSDVGLRARRMVRLP